jgi:hypothetical protein
MIARHAYNLGIGRYLAITTHKAIRAKQDSTLRDAARKSLLNAPSALHCETFLKAAQVHIN